MIKRLMVVMIFCLSLVFVQSGQVLAQGVETNVLQNYDLSITSTNVSLSGRIASKDFFFQVPDYWKVDHLKFNLDYKVSPLILNNQSSVTLTMNGTHFYSFRPSGNEAKEQQLSITIPNDLIIAGTNTLSIEGHIQTSDKELDVCTNEDDRDSWLQIYNTSSISLQHTNIALDGSISGFNKYFTGMDVMKSGQSAIVVPEQSESTELEAAVYALTGFTKANSLEDKMIPILSYNSKAIPSKKAVVVVSLYDHLSDQLKNLLTDQDFKQTALIQLVNKDKQPTLVITSQNSELLVKAGRFVANTSLMEQIDSHMKVITQDTVVATPVTTIDRNVTLTENGDTLKGWGHQEISYFVSLPSNRTISDASKISIDLRYAQNLDFNRSMVTVLLNDIPIGSKKLTTELAEGDTITLPIPKNLNISGNFNITVALDLELLNEKCFRNQDQMPWAFITRDSLLKLNTTEQTELLFNNYPYPFIRDGSYNRVAVVMPSDRDDFTYLAVSNIFNLLGRSIEGNMGEVQFFENTAEASDLSDRNIITIGTYQNNKVIADHNQSLYFKYGSDGSGFLSNEKVSIDVDYGKRIGTLQLIQSPYEAGHGFMAVTGPSSDVYYLASKLIATDEEIWKIYGDAVLTDKDGNIDAYRFKTETAPVQTSLLDQVTQRADIVGFMVSMILVLVLVLVSLILIIRKHRKKGSRRS
ncbi:cellulose biosynthesis cyclic di-GMP-binding regulatory protein BcsB [Paenibacillus crassostreae]|uniref:Cellulose synthase n=1 Tax=Paenibacillus crassostreae TaxID=1763538 RepID=A0A167FGV0_9BACL|nr:cellulose biosynthesis cyclic di-GMP-binding regulatory protein BcsB [Paenibacillus crassostreae]AOZ94418.1 cellulose synthase [Paenibacillus crassostreae]OAB76546.1 cellulose synthase [Paenibacillus crassostreae]